MTNKVNILVVEDELIVAEDMRMMLESLGYNVVGIAMDYSEALDLLKEASPDVVLCDITLGGVKSGIDVGLEVRKSYDLPFVFITSHTDRTTVEKAKQVRPNGYLVKPFESEDLFTSVEMALVNYTSGTEVANANQESTGIEESGLLIRNSLYIKDGHLFVKVKIDDLLWIKSDGNYLELHTSQKRYLIRSSLREFMIKLPPKRFFRIQKSYVVNLEEIEAINGSNLLVRGQKLPIGRSFRELLLKQLNTA